MWPVVSAIVSPGATSSAGVARSRRIDALRSSAYAWLTIRSRGRAMKSGSASALFRSAKARLEASAYRWAISALCHPRAVRSQPSRMLPISAMVAPPEDGGCMEITSWPRYSKATGSRHTAS